MEERKSTGFEDEKNPSNGRGGALQERLLQWHPGLSVEVGNDMTPPFGHPTGKRPRSPRIGRRLEETLPEQDT